MNSDVVISQKWRFWPVMCIAFLYPINNALVNLATPLYFFSLGTDLQIIGLMAAGTTITYCFSPLLLNKIGNKIGRKLSVILALLGTSLAQLIFYFTLEPFLFLITRIIEGFAMGLFWPNLQSSISDKNSIHNNQYISKFNFSWNLGVLIGFLIGALILFYVDDVKNIFYIAPFLIFVDLLISIVFLQETITKDNNQSISKEVVHHSNQNSKTMYIPIIIPMLLAIAYSLARAGVNFLYPIKSEIIGFETYTVYLFAFYAMITQLIATTIASYFKNSEIKKVSILSMVVLIITFMLFGINSNFFMFILLFLLLGFFSGLLYSFGLKLILSLNIEKHNSKFSALFESTIGLTYLITPVLTGYIALIHLSLSFYVISLGFLVVLALSLLFMKKLKI